MSEEKKEFKKDKLMNETLMYLGKLVPKNGAKGVTKDGKEWRRWKLNFKKGKFDWNVSMFEPASDKSIQVSDLKEESYYQIVYKLNEFMYVDPDTGQESPSKSKSAILIKEGKEENSTENVFGKPESLMDKINECFIQNWDEFSKVYNENTDEKDKSEEHMLGSFIANYFDLEFSEVINKIQNTKNGI